MTPREPDSPANATAVGSGVPYPGTNPDSPDAQKRRQNAATRLAHRLWRTGLDNGWRGVTAATEWFRGHDTLDRGLALLNEQLGLTPDAEDDGLAHREPATVARPTAEVARSIVYAPDMDGQTDPGEVVWAPVLLEGDAEKPRERAVVVVGRHKQTLLGALISTRERHADSPTWLFIGSGAWDPEGRPSWVRLDKIIEVPEVGIRRSGAVMPRRRFDRIAARLRSDYHWS